MPEIIVTLHNSVGLHARPAAAFVQTAKRYQSEVRVTHGERAANAKSILSVLALGAGTGAQLIIQADGDDADEVLGALHSLVSSNFGELT